MNIYDDEWGVILLEAGMPRCIPGLFENTPALTFPLWGGYSFFDFQLSRLNKEQKKLLFIDTSLSREAIRKTFIFKEHNITPVIIENDSSAIKKIYTIIDNFPFKRVLIINMASVSFIIPENTIPDNIKFSINNTPVDIYYFTKKHLLKELKNYKETDIHEMHPIQFFMERILSYHFESLYETKGQVFFNNQLMDYYHNNLWIIENQLTPIFQDFLKHQSGFQTNEGVISPSGHVISSVIMPGSVIHGKVKQSIIFKEVEIGQGTEVRNSVIMTGNKIAGGCRIENTLILPCPDDSRTLSENIKEGVSIGDHKANGSNRAFKDQISDGLTVIGGGTILPEGLNVGPGCCIGPGLLEKDFQNIKKILPYTHKFNDSL